MAGSDRRLAGSGERRMNTMANLVFEGVGLKKEFDDGQVRALRGVDFRIAKDEFVAVIGPSGCGKSTLLQMLGALDRPSAGTLHYHGNSIPDSARSPRWAGRVRRRSE